jgi:hypothetical protein
LILLLKLVSTVKELFSHEDKEGLIRIAIFELVRRDAEKVQTETCLR